LISAAQQCTIDRTFLVIDYKSYLYLDRVAVPPVEYKRALVFRDEREQFSRETKFPEE